MDTRRLYSAFGNVASDDFFTMINTVASRLGSALKATWLVESQMLLIHLRVSIFEVHSGVWLTSKVPVLAVRPEDTTTYGSYYTIFFKRIEDLCNMTFELRLFFDLFEEVRCNVSVDRLD